MALLKSYNIKRFPLFYETIRNNYNVKNLPDKELQKCYNTLGVPKNCDQDTIRIAYLELAKKYHPDSGGADADTNKFYEIDRAFQMLQDQKVKERSSNENDIAIHTPEFDINHIAPQHRQYLSYEGIGIGNPSQREKQYGKIRAMHAAENILNHRLNKNIATENALLDKQPQQHKIKTKYGYERLVEDLIQEAMSRGDFDNLSGKGQPLKGNQTTNPYVDFTTHKLNQVLIDNGFTPEWIMMQKDIRSEREQIQKMLHTDRSKLAHFPFVGADKIAWDNMLDNYYNVVESLNRKIKSYNLIVPIIQKQMLLFNLEKEAHKIAETGQTRHNIQVLEKPLEKVVQKNTKNIFSYIESLFKKLK